MAAAIHVLSKEVSNLIAAGEVVARPASVVKELLENAIDAGATRIRVSVDGPELDEIQVSDNGSGIAAEDMPTAFLSHATSKISTAFDLQQNLFLGFRGEALPSIAAVSELEMVSRPPEQELACRILVLDGKPGTPESLAAPAGTTVTVRKLFRNTPARRKFLKKPATEMGYISDLLDRLALSRPDIRFQLLHNGRTVLKTAGRGELLQAAMDVYGSGVAAMLLPVQGPGINGLLSKPALTRSSNKYCSFFVNRRWVKSREFSRLLEDVYHTRLPIGRFPVALIHLEIAPELVDINVHPNKMEIKFHDFAAVSKELEAAMLAALQSGDDWLLRPRQPLTPPVPRSAAPRPKPQQSTLQVAARPQREAAAPSSGRASFREEWAPYLVSSSAAVPSPGPVDGEKPLAEMPPSALPQPEKDEAGKAETGMEQAVPPVPAAAPARAFVFSELHYLGQFEGTYLVAAGPGGLYLLDQHAAHERVRYEHYKRRAEEEKTSPPLDLAIPVPLELRYRQKTLLIERILQLRDMGFIVEEFGPESYVLRAVPAWFDGENGAELLIGILDRIEADPDFTPARFQESEIFMMACKSAIKAKRRVDPGEVAALFAQLDACENPYTCPHGRPVYSRIASEEIHKRFLRRS